MNRDSLATLFHPFASGALNAPGADARVLFLGAEPGFRLPEGFEAQLALVQGFRPHFLKLAAGGHAVSPEPEGDGYDMALVLAGKHRGLNEARLAEAWDRTRPGGLVVVAGGKADGVDSLRKRTAAVIDVEGSLSKYHGGVFWLRRTAADRPFVKPADKLVEGRFHTAPGMFSHDRVDPGSRLLAEHLPADLSGAVADFCAGWGYLSAAVLERCPAVASLDLYEADHASLEAARLNLGDARAPIGFHWIDLATEPVPRRHDAVVMNPPFHEGRAGDPSLGRAMIRAASAALKPGGRLFMVANRHLPYEAELAAAFRQSGELVRDAAFKVLWARR